MVKTILSKAWKAILKKPVKLWGISLLNILLTCIFDVLFGLTLGVSLAFSLLLSTSMTMIFLHGYRGEEVTCTQLFESMKDFNTAKRVVLGMAWMALWVFIWALIPVVGFIFAIKKAYAYRLTPYILVLEPDVSITDACKVSEARTEGYKAKMFGAELAVFAIIFGVTLVLGLLSGIRGIGILFAIVGVVVELAIAIFSPLYFGLVQAAFYEEIETARKASATPQITE